MCTVKIQMSRTHGQCMFKDTGLRGEKEEICLRVALQTLDTTLTGEISRPVSLYTALAEDRNSVPSTIVEWLTISCKFSSREADTFRPPYVPSHTHTIKTEKKSIYASSMWQFSFLDFLVPPLRGPYSSSITTEFAIGIPR